MNILTPPPGFTNGDNPSDWPRGDFRPTITLTKAAAIVTLSGTLDNVSDFVYGVPVALQATCTVWVNGTVAATYSIDSQTGALSGPPIQVVPGDEIVARFEAKSTIITPYDNQWVQRQDLAWTAPAGNGSITFNAATNPQQAPTWNATIGAAPGNNFQVVLTPIDAGGSTQDLTITTQVAGGALRSSSTASQSPPVPTTHTSLFDRAQASAGFEAWFSWANNAGNRASFAALLFRNESLIGAADPFNQNEINGAAQWQP
ncbi:MAG: hypothetical protein AAFV53_02965 [Myxococcota bacterium]